MADLMEDADYDSNGALACLLIETREELDNLCNMYNPPIFDSDATLEIGFQYSGEQLPTLPFTCVAIESTRDNPYPVLQGWMPYVTTAFLRNVSLAGLTNVFPRIQELHLSYINVDRSFAEAFPGRLISVYQGTIDLGKSRVSKLDLRNSTTCISVSPNLLRLRMISSNVVVFGKSLELRVIGESASISMSLKACKFIGLINSTLQLSCQIECQSVCVENSAVEKPIVCKTFYVENSIAKFICSTTRLPVHVPEKGAWKYENRILTAVEPSDQIGVVDKIYDDSE